MTEQHATITIDNKLLKSKPAGILLHLKKTNKDYGSGISKSVDTTYAHTIKLLKDLKSDGLIRRTEGGSSDRSKYYELTEDGETAAKAIEDLVDVFQEG